MLSFLFVLVKFVDGFLYIYLLPVFKGYDKATFELRCQLLLGAHHFVVVGRVATSIFVKSAFLVVANVFQTFQSLIVLDQLLGWYSLYHHAGHWHSAEYSC